MNDRSPRAPRRAMIAVGLSTVVEWYDFTLCLYFAPTLSRVFFGSDGESLGKTLAGFAIAYVMRPVGAIFFGQFGDRRGRKPTLLLSMSLMTIAMLGLALLPTYQQVGPVAGLLLIAMRCVMGFSIGGEYPAVVAYLFETARPHRRGLVTSLAAAASEVGGLIAVGLCSWLTVNLDAPALESWGWRIPFLIGALLAAAIWLVRAIVPEPPAFVAARNSGTITGSPLARSLSGARKSIAIGFAISALGSITYYVGITYVPSFIKLTNAANDATALHLSTMAAFCVIVVTPLVGWLSDLTGRKRVLLALSGLCILLPPILFNLVLSEWAGIAVLLLAALAGGVSAVGAVATAEQFPASIRLSGLALGATTATAIFGGAAPFVAYELQRWSNSPATPGFMIAAVALVSGAILYAIMPARHSSVAVAADT